LTQIGFSDYEQELRLLLHWHLTGVGRTVRPTLFIPQPTKGKSNVHHRKQHGKGTTESIVQRFAS